VSTSDSEAEIPQKAASAAAGEGFRKPSEHPTIQGFHSTMGVHGLVFFPLPSRLKQAFGHLFVSLISVAFWTQALIFQGWCFNQKEKFFIGKTMDVFQGLFFT